MIFTRSKLARFFSEQLGLRVILRIHRNKTNWLSFKKDQHEVQLSLHEHFLNGPDFIREDVLGMMKGKKGLSPESRAYLFSQEGQNPKEKPIDAMGKCWNLEDLYKEVIEDYALDPNLKITWFGEEQKKRGRIILGQFDPSNRLVKIHRLLDSPSVPKFLVRYVIYHEILHSIYTPQPHLKGFLSIHPKEFKIKEREFLEYSAAQMWLKNNKQKLFF